MDPSILMLAKPTKAMEQAIWAFRQEFLDTGEQRINGSCGLGFINDFDRWLCITKSIEREELSREGVHASTYFSVRKSDGMLIGSIQLRHALTPELERHGGHIGYAVRPSERGNGYGKQQLCMVLQEARLMGLHEVMVSCDKCNEASIATILACNGELRRVDSYGGVPQLVYWIKTGSVLC